MLIVVGLVIAQDPPRMAWFQMRRGPGARGIARHVLHAAAPQPGEQIPLRGGPVIEIVEVAGPTVHLVTAIEFYGPGYARAAPGARR